MDGAIAEADIFSNTAKNEQKQLPSTAGHLEETWCCNRNSKICIFNCLPLQ